MCLIPQTNSNQTTKSTLTQGLHPSRPPLFTIINLCLGKGDRRWMKVLLECLHSGERRSRHVSSLSFSILVQVAHGWWYPFPSSQTYSPTAQRSRSPPVTWTFAASIPTGSIFLYSSRCAIGQSGIFLSRTGEGDVDPWLPPEKTVKRAAGSSQVVPCKFLTSHILYFLNSLSSGGAI